MIKNTACQAEAGIVHSVRSVGDSYDNARAEIINGLCKAEASIGASHDGRSKP